MAGSRFAPPPVVASQLAGLFDSHVVVVLGIIATFVMTVGDRLTHRPDTTLGDGFEGVDVGHALGVQLVRANVEQGATDFELVLAFTP